MEKQTGVEEINPYGSAGEKGQQVEKMFDSIAPAYDFMNSAMSFGLHKSWRRKAIKNVINLFGGRSPQNILDVATGTGDLVFYLHKKLPDAKITGIDLSAGMLAEARKKLEKFTEVEKKNLSFGKADCLALPFFDGLFDLITVAYGVRNFSNLKSGLKEMNRVLRKGGFVCVIELSEPETKICRGAYRFYSNSLIPFFGRMVSGDKRAYSYLPQSIAACPQREKMATLMEEAGFKDNIWKSLSLGAVTYYIGKKP